MKAVLLAAGLGTRLRPLTDRMPKCLVPVAGRPLLDHWLDRLRDAGVSEVLINTHHMPEAVRAHLEERGGGDGLVVTEAFEPVLLGSAGTITANRSYLDDAGTCLVVYSDNLSDIDIAGLLEFHASHPDPLSMALFRAPEPKRCGIAELDESGRILSFREKPENPVGDLANAGVYAIDAETFREIADMRASDFGFDVLPRLEGRMRGWSWGGYHRDIGTPLAYALAQEDAPGLFGVRAPASRPPAPAVFLDRDGTIIEHRHYLSDPDDVVLLPGVAEGLRGLADAGHLLVVVTNQSAVGRGMITEERLREIHVRLRVLLLEEGVALDGVYHCPTVPKGSSRTVVEDPDRKPGPGMLRRAAYELGIRLTESWMIGDMASDVLAGHHAGCEGSILIETSKPLDEEELEETRGICRVTPDFATATAVILSESVSRSRPARASS